MGLLSFLLKSAATKIGQVVGGDYKGAMVGYGSKSDKFTIKVTSPNKKDVSNDALIIFAKPMIKFNRDDITSYSVHNSTFSTTTYTVEFKNGKRSLIEINNSDKHKVEAALF